MDSENSCEVRLEPEGEQGTMKEGEISNTTDKQRLDNVCEGAEEVMETDKQPGIEDDSGGTEIATSQCAESTDPSVSPSPHTSSVDTGPKEEVSFKVIYNKQKFDVTFPLDDSVASLKTHIETLTGVPSSMQKVMFKGKMQDDQTLRDQKVIKGSKVMVIGSTVNDIMSVSAPDAATMKEIEKQASDAGKVPLCKQKPHKTILEKHGKPDDAMLGVKRHKEPLPPAPISGMYNKSGGKVRLTFKLAQDQLWIGTKERTEKVQMASIKAVVSEPIEGHEEYHLMGIQLGPTEASRYWVYWVPAQYADAIKDAILGKWQTELF